MPSIPVGFAQAKFEFGTTSVTRQMCFTLAFGQHSSDGDDLEAHELANDLATRFSTVFTAPNTSTGWTFFGVTAQVQEIADSQDVAHSDREITVSGTWNPVSLPVNCAILVEKHTSKGGKRYRGRMYVPPCYISANNVGPSGNIQAAEWTTLGTRWNAFYQSLVSPGSGRRYQPVLLHNQKEGGATNYIPTEITSFAVDPMVATQRKRLR
jgi:hypothetical protein